MLLCVVIGDGGATAGGGGGDSGGTCPVVVVVVVGARAFAAMAPNGRGATGSWRPLARVVCTSAGHLAYMAVGQYFERGPPPSILCMYP